MRLYSQVQLGVNPEINAVSTLLIGVVATGAIAVCLAQQRRRPKL
jgi:putrescine transport system permease protein